MDGHEMNGNGGNGHTPEGNEIFDWEGEGNREWEDDGEFLSKKRREVRDGIQSFFMTELERGNGI